MYIDKKQVYSVGNYTFHNFITLSDDMVLKIWEWRNSPEIRKYMYTKDIIPLENHLRYVKSLENRDDVAYWLVCKDGEPIGVTSLTDIDMSSSTAELGYYMIPTKLNSGLGLEFAYYNMQFVFCSTIACEYLHGGIHRTNINALTLDSYLGCEINMEDFKDPNKEFVSWSARRDTILSGKCGSNDMRQFVIYMREHRKNFIN